MENQQTIIDATILFDGKGKSENKTIVIENEKIIDILNKPLKADYSGIVTPAFIDPHSHIGMDRQGEPYQESEVNDHINQITPLHNPLNSIYFDDRAFKDTVDFGVLYSCVVPGSGNLMGGRAMIIKNFAANRNDAFIKDYGYKLALGYNPRSTDSWKGTRPSTRMGVYSLLEKKFDEVLNKEKKQLLEKEKKLHELEKKINGQKLSNEARIKEEEFIKQEFELEFDQVEKAILELLHRKKTAKVHVHKEDDVLYLADFIKKYNITATAEHTGDVFNKEIFDYLGDNNIDIIYGPLGSLDYKVELKHAYYQNTKLLMESKAFFGLMTDHPVILSHHLRDSLKYFLIQGMTDAEAISLITYKNAKILGLDDCLGTIEKGKLASIILWNKDPLNLGAFPKAVIAEGNVIRDFTQ